jgi:hypothetical protein
MTGVTDSGLIENSTSSLLGAATAMINSVLTFAANQYQTQDTTGGVVITKDRCADVRRKEECGIEPVMKLSRSYFANIGDFSTVPRLAQAKLQTTKINRIINKVYSTQANKCLKN